MAPTASVDRLNTLAEVALRAEAARGSFFESRLENRVCVENLRPHVSIVKPMHKTTLRSTLFTRLCSNYVVCAHTLKVLTTSTAYLKSEPATFDAIEWARYVESTEDQFERVSSRLERLKKKDKLRLQRLAERRAVRA